tara:strand:- start:177 stop:605 length:429 start_codon:yes stop_codon:yes gene_type:complete
MPYKDYKQDVLWRWKHYGIISDDWDELYQRYVDTTHCEKCNVELVVGNFGSNKKAIDHDHRTGEVRYICCHRCNMNIEKMTQKNNKLQEKNIAITRNGKYCFRQQVYGKKYSKNFETLEEAISYRDWIFSQPKIPATILSLK